MDSCNEHVGQGGGQPHLHGDPFGDEAPTKCLYGPSNYTGDQYGETGHPPLVGFGADGILIYGENSWREKLDTSILRSTMLISTDLNVTRLNLNSLNRNAPYSGRYLYPTQLGFQEPLLDTCGGHTHTTPATSAQDPYGLLDDYHYHTQGEILRPHLFAPRAAKTILNTRVVFDATVDGSGVADEGDTYSVTTTGPFNCYRANLTASKGSMALYEAAKSLSDGKSTMENRCCDMTDYYILTGLSFPDSGTHMHRVESPAANTESVKV